MTCGQNCSFLLCYFQTKLSLGRQTMLHSTASDKRKQNIVPKTKKDFISEMYVSAESKK